MSITITAPQLFISRHSRCRFFSYAWGNSQHGQLALINPNQNHWQPTLADGLREWRCARVCFGTFHAAARTVDGSVLTWGRQFECCLGRKGVMDDHIVQPGVVQGLPSAAVVKVLCGSMHTAAVTRAGQVFTWGSGDSGALGHGGLRSCLMAYVLIF